MRELPSARVGELKRDEEERKREKCESARVAKCESWGIEEG